MSKFIGALAAVMSLILPVSGCFTEFGSPEIENTMWILDSLTNKSSQVQPSDINLRLPSAVLSDGEVSGFLGLNSFSGRYQLSGNDISFSQLTSTELIASPEAMNIEALFLSALESAAHVKVQDQTLTISDLEDTVLARFSPSIEG